MDKTALLISKIIDQILNLNSLEEEKVSKVIYKNPDENGEIFSKGRILKIYSELKKLGIKDLPEADEKKLLLALKMKKTRTMSGVTPVTVLTKPYECPGRCIYCPYDKNMPKSYLSSEPGAQRALSNNFDPYLQTFNRLVAYNNIGHPTDKVELIILGGTWSYYPENYQIWFVKRCFDALNDFDQFNNCSPINPKNYLSEEIDYSWDDLFKTHQKNENAKSRCIGLVVETRPDYVTEEEIIKMRKLGATKVQIGVQSLNDKVLNVNNRGHNVSQTKKAFELLRMGGFKIHAHWMANLYGSDVKKDIEDFKKLFDGTFFKPDELKIYPCSLIEGTKLMDFYKRGEWKPYTDAELLEVLQNCLVNTPRFCRVTRVVRDISSDDIVCGNKKTNFRQIVDADIKKKGLKVEEIRSREIRDSEVNVSDLFLKITKYETSVSNEVFFEYINDKDLIAGFLRLSLPKGKNFVKEIENSAMIREIHVYGQSLNIGEKEGGIAQHSGLGKSLIEKAKEYVKGKDFADLAVISAVGTREYYRKRGFVDGLLYQHLSL